MAVTQNTYTGDGSTVLFSFTFPYLNTTDIKVSLDDVVTSAYTLANATTIQFNTAPANGVAIRIYRVTDDSALAAEFFPGSAIRAQDLNDNYTQNLYVTQESNREATNSVVVSTAAINLATIADANATTAVATSNTALANSTAAVATANTAEANSNSAVTTANAADAASSAAVATANSAATDAAAAVVTADSAAADAAQALSTANQALADSAVAVSDAAAAVVTADAADVASAAAVVTANTAAANASTAVSTANAADIKSDQAIAAVANALLFDIVADVASIPGTPADGDAVEITDSTGIESFNPLVNVPVGFVGDSGLSARIIYQSAITSWVWLQYFPNDPDNRYAGPNTAAGTAAAPTIAFGPTDTDTGLFSPGADEFAIATGGVARLTVDSTGTVSVGGDIAVTGAITSNGLNAVLSNDAALTDERTPLDGSVTTAKIDTLAVTTGKIADSAVTSSKIANGTIIDGNVSATATIAGTKISPDFGSQSVTTTGTLTAAALIPSSSSVPTNGVYLPSANNVAIASSSSERIRIGDNGEIGIGGANYGTSGQVLTSNGSGAAPGWTTMTFSIDKIEEGNTSAEVIDANSDGRFVVATEGAERMSVDSDYSVFAGLYTIRSSASGSTQTAISFRGSATNNSSGTEKFRVRGNGDVQNNNGVYGTISDLKLKENIVDANSQWSDIKALEIKNYNLIGDDTRQIGLIAQEVELVSPGLVDTMLDLDDSGAPTGTVSKGVKTSILYMKAVKALQEAMERIEVLERRLADAGIT